MADKFQTLKDELTNDPLGRGYAGMTDQEAAADINSEYVQKQKDTAEAVDLYEWTDITEFQSKTDVQKQYIRDIWSLSGDIPVGAGSKARTVYISVFGAGVTTIQNILAGLTFFISRGDDLKIGQVSPGDVNFARSLP